MLFLFLLALLGALSGADMLVGQVRLARFAAHEGWRVLSTRWHPRLFTREVEFGVVLERGGEQRTGVALVGRPWAGPMLSSKVTLQLD